MQLNKHKENLNNECHDNKEFKDPWLVNCTDAHIPDNVNDVLRLGNNFSSLFSTIKNDMVLEIIKDIESNMEKIKIEKDREELRHKLLNTTYNFLNSSQNISAVDKALAKNLKESKLFLQKNTELFITKADKGNVTVILNLSDYNEKMLQLLNDNSTYKKINYNPLELMNKKNKNKHNDFTRCHVLIYKCFV